uniref:Calreticulin n=1 Tax=Callorhinchus milii TaxID=7868 RepID=V9KA51_CALMI
MEVALLLVCLLAASAHCTVYFTEQFGDGDAWESRWVESKHKSDYGQFKLTAGKFYGDPEKDKGLQTSQDAKFYASSARFEPFNNEGKTLVIQFTVKHEQKIDCGGGYIKLFPSNLDQKAMHGDSSYYIMFGPDICGYSTKKVHVIFNYKEKNHLIKKDITCKDDELTHLYTLILRPDQTYEVKIDNAKVESGKLEEDWDFLQLKKIKDPEAKKPEDWDERSKINDPEDVKPEDWEKPENIPDPEAKKPEDWDEEMDGEWEPPMIPNPEYKGEWQPKQIDNPNYKGVWVHPEIDNPAYVADMNIYSFKSIGVLGLDLWQVKSGTIFDNFLITDDEKYAETFGSETWGQTKEPEQKMKEIQDKEESEKRKEEEQKSKEEEDGDEDEDAEEEEEEEEEKSEQRNEWQQEAEPEPEPEPEAEPEPEPEVEVEPVREVEKVETVEDKPEISYKKTSQVWNEEVVQYTEEKVSKQGPENGEALHEEIQHKHKKMERNLRECSRSDSKATHELEETEAARLEAEQKLEELRRRQGEKENEEFEKMRIKQQEAAVELEELKKKREGRKKVREEEEQKRLQEESEKKAREEEEKRKLKEDIEKRRAEAAEKRYKPEELEAADDKEPFKCVTPRGSSLKIGERAEFLNKSAKKSTSIKTTRPLLGVSKIDSKLEQYTSAIQGAKAAKGGKSSASDLPLTADGVRNIKSMWETGDVYGSPSNKGTPNKEVAGLKVGVAGRINQWLNKTPETNKSPASKASDVKPGDVSSKRNLWENKTDSPNEKSATPSKITAGSKFKSGSAENQRGYSNAGMAHYENEP